MSAVTRVAALMRFPIAVVLSLALAFAGCNREPYSRSNSGFSSTERKVLYDFRGDNPGLGAKLDAETKRKVLSTVFPSYLSDERQCKSGDSRQTVAEVLGSADGSFTAAGLKQTAYLIDAAECRPNSRSRRLVVFTSGTLAANVEAPPATAIAATYDLDGDGKQELLLEFTAFGQGAVTHTATLVEIAKDKLAVVEDFGQVYHRDCGAKLPISATVVYYLPPPAGQKARFTVELYRAACAPAGQAKPWARAPEN